MRVVHSVGGSPHRRLMLRAAITSTLLSLLFVVVYGSTNWLTAHRDAAAVGKWFFPWELSATPYVPWLLVPYMSIDLLFFGAAFLCRDDQELRTYSGRVTFSIIVAGLFFLVLPLKLAWPARPYIAGWFGEFVEQSCTAPFLMEYPHNLFPAMHITLCIILAEIYSRHTRGWLRSVLMIWFGLIGISTVLTWQHHLIDIAGGILLAAFAFYLFNESDQLPVERNTRIGSYYAAGAAILAGLTPLQLPGSVFLLWPVSALSIVASAYFGIGPRIYCKTDGRLPWSTRIVLALILIGQYLSLLYYRRRSHAWDEVAPGLLVGRMLSENEAAEAVRHGVTAVFDLTAEFSETATFRNLRYQNVPILDLTAPTLIQLQQAVKFISEEVNHGAVYLHCKIGYSRSVAVAGAYLLASGQATSTEEAIAQLRTSRPGMIVRTEITKAIRMFENHIHGKGSIEQKVPTHHSVLAAGS